MAEYYFNVALEQMVKEDMNRKSQEEACETLLESYKMGIAEWITKSGDTLLITDMTNEHILNTLKFLTSKTKKERNYLTDTWIVILRAETKKRKIS